MKLTRATLLKNRYIRTVIVLKLLSFRYKERQACVKIVALCPLIEFMDFLETWYIHHAIRGHSTFVLFISLPSLSET
jgi:hypothetical protein